MTAVDSQLAEALRDRYVLERELGRGGMATVYLARDLRHDRPVALKVLHPDLAHALGADRFQREIKLAARLQHPHILTVHDSGETDGRLWFTMPYVEGESLRDRLRREQRLPVEEALRITREAAQALHYAHEHGVVHRDIKPENLLLTKDGSTLIADFGIARAVEGDEHLTKTGSSMGTPAYMSPEQANGEPADARTDVYSLGAVLYEMLAGKPPFTGSSAVAIVAKWLTEPIPSVRATRPDVPEDVDQSIQRALARSAPDRFATTAEFVRALQGAPSGFTPVPPPVVVPAPAAARRWRVPLAAAVLGVAVVAGALFARHRTHAGVSESAGPKLLAVLPFENLGDSADAYFADGVTEAVRGKLSRLAGLDVIARGSSNQYRHTTKAPQEIARELGADYLLTATVRWEKAPGGGSRVRVTPELVDVRPGRAPRTRWQDSFDASLTDVFQVQADIATTVAGALDVALGDSARRDLTTQPTHNLAAYDAFLKGEAATQSMGVYLPSSLRPAIGFYEQAVALDSSFVTAWVQLARARSLLYINSTPTPELAAQAHQAADRAQALGPGRPDGPQALGTYYSFVVGDNRQALAAYEAGLELAPNNVDLLWWVASTEQRLGRWEAALTHLTKAGALDPRSANPPRLIGTTLTLLRRYPEAQAALDRAQTLAPTNLPVIAFKTMLALAQGDLAGARAVIRTALTTFEPAALIASFANYWDLYWPLDDAQQQQLLALPPSAFDNDRAAWALVRAETEYLRGHPADARVYADTARLAIEEQLRAAPEDPQRHGNLGLALAYLGRKAEAIQEGERGVALMPISRDALLGAYVQHQLVRIYLLVGEPEKALDQLEPLLRMPYSLSPGWLRIDPTFAPLKGNP
ncbi:MAG TPA: protein kinase, partial [Gemmatimonadales bacterium]|nr:protein kinase [Gemmatimonadales bacterium]